MDRLAAHVIATAALTLTLATVPVLFADASHAASASAPAVLATTSSPSQESDARSDGSSALPALPALTAETQTQAPASAETAAAGAAPQAAGARPCLDVRQVGATHALDRRHGRIAFPWRTYSSPSCHSLYGYSFAGHRARPRHVRYAG